MRRAMLIRVSRVFVACGFALSGCGGDGPSNPGLTGASDAGGTIGTDASADSIDVEDASDVTAPPFMIIVRVDGIDVVPAADASPSPTPQEPVHYGFDTGVGDWQVVPSSPDDMLVGRSITHSDEDVAGVTTSGSLEVRWTFEAFGANADTRGVNVRAFSSATGPPRNWKGYRITARAKTSPFVSGCAVNGALYVLAGPEQKIVISNRIWLSNREWRVIEFDLATIDSLADLTHITEFGFSVGRDFCVPP